MADPYRQRAFRIDDSFAFSFFIFFIFFILLANSNH